MNDTFAYFTMAWFDPSLLLLTALGTLGGIYIGAIPGLSVTMAVSILISFTFTWDINNALALMVGIYVGGRLAGRLSESFFRSLILVVLAASAGSLFWSVL